jgi:octopine/nopaline transport system substrate-binding protein
MNAVTRRITLALAAMVWMSGLAEARSVKIGVEGAFPPFNQVDATGKLSGFEIEMTDELCKRAKLDCSYVVQDWDSLLPSLLNGKFDLVLNMGPNETRRKVIGFTDMYAFTPNQFLVTKDGPLAQVPGGSGDVNVDEPGSKAVVENLRKALAKRTIGGQAGTSQLAFVQDTFGNIATVRTYKTVDEEALDLNAGRIDAVYTNAVVAAAFLKQKGNENLVTWGPKMSGGIQATQVCYGIRKEDTDLKAVMDAQIRGMIADGTITRLSDKWFGFDASPRQ